MTTPRSGKRRAAPKTRAHAKKRAAPALPLPVRRSRGAPADAGAAALADALTQIDDSIDVLSKVVARLTAMSQTQVSALALADRQARARAISNAGLAIEDLENAKLAALNEAFEARRPELARATSKLAGDLAQLQDVVAFIGAAAAAVGIVADIAAIAA